MPSSCDSLRPMYRTPFHSRNSRWLRRPGHQLRSPQRPEHIRRTEKCDAACPPRWCGGDPHTEEDLTAFCQREPLGLALQGGYQASRVQGRRPLNLAEQKRRSVHTLGDCIELQGGAIAARSPPCNPGRCNPVIRDVASELSLHRSRTEHPVMRDSGRGVRILSHTRHEKPPRAGRRESARALIICIRLRRDYGRCRGD